MSGVASQVGGARVVICVGAGGVGKTTVSAAIGLGLAGAGARVALVTIDPARRLAEALGRDGLGNRPSLVDPKTFGGAGVKVHGELWAMMLDVRRTFDELIAALAPNHSVRDQILANPVYCNLSTGVAGSQEYTAMAKLFELAESGAYDAIVLDTPPSRNALDFLQAPGRLTRFLEGRAFSLLALPGGGAARTAGVMLGALSRVAGVALLQELATFFRQIGGLAGGFRDRADRVQALFADPATAFVVITTPERSSLEEARFLAHELAAAGMHRRAMIVNRVHPLAASDSDVEATKARLAPMVGQALAAKVARTYYESQRLGSRHANEIERLRDGLDGEQVLCLTEHDDDIHDIDGLVALQRELFAQPSGDVGG
jgi:anion-transporting  ArsA/GET3 family ATPase